MTENVPEYYGITHSMNKKEIKNWQGCKVGWHLFDEVISYHYESPTHYLMCDCCELVVNIKSIDTQHVEK